MNKIKKIFLIILISLFTCFSYACVDKQEANEPDEIVDPSGNQGEKAKTTPRFKEDYTPTLFSSVTYEEKEIVDGLILYTYTLTKANGDITIINELEADLNKVRIEAGTKDNKALGYAFQKVVPYEAATSYTQATNKQVYASLNADFFGSVCVNAFVKDGIIIKDSHNDNNNYDYLNSASDVPASAPMLFGIKGNTAQVAPIISYSGDIKSAIVKMPVIKAKLSYTINTGIKSIDTSDSLKIVTSALAVNADDMYALLDLSKGVNDIEVLEIGIVDKKMTLIAPSANKAYLYCASSNTEGLSFLNRVSVGSKISLSVKSPDGLWNGYETILGCRQALVMGSNVASTVTLENTNGAQGADIPRSAVGINVDGKVCIYAVESLYYGRKANEGDSHGCDLPTLAEFMVYNNIVNGANFDGGGSTQLICKIDGVDKVVVRSSDTGSTELASTRQVMNVIMVVEK